MRVVKATLRGGPSDGQKREVPDEEWEIDFVSVDPASRSTKVRPSALTARANIKYVRHRYRRTDDWLRDGSVIFEYVE